MRVRLLRDHYLHQNGKVTHYKAGETVDFPNPIAEYINWATIEGRRLTRERAKQVFGSPERDR